MDFIAFPKTPRLIREVIVTEKIDGTNACVAIDADGRMFAGSRTRWITVEDDNQGFAKWVAENREELLQLGPGRHFGEWWGAGIGRRYGLKERRFSLLNTSRWSTERPACCHVAPVLYRGIFDATEIDKAFERLREFGSVASPGFMSVEGIIVFHVAANIGFKRTFDKNDQSKGRQKSSACSRRRQSLGGEC